MGGDLSGELLLPGMPGTSRGLCPAPTAVQGGGCCSVAWCLLAAACLLSCLLCSGSGLQILVPESARGDILPPLEGM